MIDALARITWYLPAEARASLVHIVRERGDTVLADAIANASLLSSPARAVLPPEPTSDLESIL